MYTYVINRLRVDHRSTERAMLTLVGETGKVSVQDGIDIGIRIEERGEWNARWSFVGQIDLPSGYLDQGHGRTDQEWRSLWNVDLARFTF